jgi:hypothetical protein
MADEELRLVVVSRDNPVLQEPTIDIYSSNDGYRSHIEPGTLLLSSAARWYSLTDGSKLTRDSVAGLPEGGSPNQTDEYITITRK